MELVITLIRMETLYIEYIFDKYYEMHYCL